MCRVGSVISETNDGLRRQFGGDVVSEAMRLATSDRDLVSSTALEASRIQGPRNFCEACHELIGRAASTSLSCGCHFHTRCAVGLVEDHLPNAMANGHDTIPCPHYGHGSGHGFRALAVLPESDSVNLYESEAGQRALDERGSAQSDNSYRAPGREPGTTLCGSR